MVTSSDAPRSEVSTTSSVSATAKVGHLPFTAPWAFGAAALSGILYWLAFPGVELWPLAFVAWVPLIVAMHSQRPWRAALLGGTAGLAMNVAGHLWLQQMLQTFSGFPAPLCFLFLLIVCAYQGGRIAFQGWLYGRGAARGWPHPWVFAGAFVASELLYPVLFPWYFSATAHNVPVLSQLGDVGGPILVGLVLVAPNVAIGESIVALLQQRPWSWRLPATASGIVVAAIAYGALRIHGVDASTAAAPGATVGVIQANMGLLEKRHQFDEGLRRHLRLSEEARRRGADFVVWSETSAMHAVRDSTYADELRNVSSRIGLPAIFGAVVVKPVPDEREYVLYNSAVSTDGVGVVSGRYDKEYLLTFGEYLPFGDSLPILYKWSPNSGHFTPGTSLDPLVLQVNGYAHPVTALICYEDILPRFTNAAVRHANPDLLVNLTNDAWFGDTAEPWEHLALAQMRAIEHRRYLVRGTNSGVSAVVDPVGRIVAHSGTFREEAIVAPVHWMHGRTAYELWGDWPWLFASAAAIGAAFLRRRTPAAA